MKIAVLGATGQTGKPLVEQALEQGHDVVAIVRTASKLDIQNEKLKVVEADIFDHECLIKHFEGCDVVMSTLGFPLDPTKPVTGFLYATGAMVSAMRRVGCKRLILMHSWYTSHESRDEAPEPIKAGLLRNISPVLDNMREAEIFLERTCGDLNYTVVLPPGLLNDPKTESPFRVLNDKFHIPEAFGRIARADVARYMLEILSYESSYKKIQAIAVEP